MLEESFKLPATEDDVKKELQQRPDKVISGNVTTNYQYIFRAHTLEANI